MRKMATMLLGILLVQTSFAIGTTEEDLEPIRMQFREVARLQGLTSKLPKHHQMNSEQKALWRQASDAERLLTTNPIDQVLAAFDSSIRGQDKQEIIGGLSVYTRLIVLHRAEPDPRYKPLLLEMLAKDDFSMEAYTWSVAGFLGFFRSRETMFAYMDAAKRSPNRVMRDRFIDSTAALLDIEFSYTLSDPPERKQKALAAFEAWYEKNKDSIRFDSKGEPHFRGGPGEWKPPKLTSADRAAIKSDPVCVLRLFDLLQNPNDPKKETVEKLNAQCGPALLGHEGSLGLARFLEKGKGDSSGNDAFSMPSAGLEYPTVSAALTAVAYIAATEPIDPEGRKLALTILDDFGEDLQEILKEEPSSVRKKVIALAESEAR